MNLEEVYSSIQRLKLKLQQDVNPLEEDWIKSRMRKGTLSLWPYFRILRHNVNQCKHTNHIDHL